MHGLLLWLALMPNRQVACTGFEAWQGHSRPFLDYQTGLADGFDLKRPSGDIS